MGAAPEQVANRHRQPTPEQRAVIEARDRDVFTEAGAGTGKTGVLVERYCDAVTEDGVGPDRILAFTFTERAAGELRERIRRLLTTRARSAAERGDPEGSAEIARAAREGERAWITTIHGFCRRLLATHPVAARMDPRFRVLDEVEAARLSERAFEAALEEVLEVGDDAIARFAAGFHPARLRAIVGAAHERLRSQGVDPPRLPDPGRASRSVKEKDESAELTPAEAKLAEDGLAALRALLAAFNRRYELLKAERSGADFADLELRALELLRGPGAVREAWRSRFEHLMVDEFQDTNRVQLALIDALRGPQTRLFTVGDEFQSIYRFRHADLEVFRERRSEAESDPATERKPLRGNFRSRPEVLAAVDFAGAALLPGFTPLEAGLEANAEPRGAGPAAELLLTDASDDKPGFKTGWRAEEIKLSPPPSETTTPSYVAEARFLAQRLQELADRGVPRGEMVVLLRAFTHVDAFEEALDRAGLAPYVVGGRGYWSQQQVEDALRLLGVVANPLDDELLFGALASPACGVSPDALWFLRQAARDPDGRPLHVWPTIADGEWPATMAAADVRRLERFREILAGLRAEAPLRPLDSLVDRAISAFDYDLALLAQPNGRRRMANVRKLMRLAREYEDQDGRDLRGFLDFAQERTRRDEREGMAAVQVEGHDGVRVMTVHAAKGLEFPVVAVADLGRGLGAGSRAPDIAIGRLEREVGDPSEARFGMRLPIAAAESLRLWELVDLCEEDTAAEVQEACRLVYVAATRAQERLILSGIYRSTDLDAPEELKPSHTALKLLLPALRSRGWSPHEREVELERAPAIGGGPAAGPIPNMVVRTQRPTAERALELRRCAAGPAAGANDAIPEPPAPLLESRPRTSAAGHLSYSALADYAGCRYRFYIERVVGASSPAAEVADAEGAEERSAGEADELVEPALGPRERSLAIGNAVHAALEASARRSWAPSDGAELEAILAREGLGADGEARDRVEALVEGWLSSELRAELEASGARIRPEVPFVLGLGGAVVRGQIDLLAEHPEGPLVVDYKTDALRGADPAKLAERYETQRDLYALAVHGARRNGAAGIVRAAYCFLEAPEGASVQIYDEARVAAARERLERLVAGIGAGDFERTDNPHPALCYGCPAAARLCAKPAWQPQWATSSTS
jgi:ATP-dependent helicase/nuclease subunit A